jgi:predicted TIM-barrel fold metal-dependent hydrolase
MTDSGARAPYEQRQYYSIYEACERNGLPLAIHPGTDGMGVNVQPSPGYPTRYSSGTLASPSLFRLTSSAS